MGDLVHIADWSWRRRRRPRSRLAQALARLEPAQRDVVLDLLTLFAPLAETMPARLDQAKPLAAGDEGGTLPEGTVPLADYPDEGLVTLCLEAGYTIGDADMFKAVLPYFLAQSFARPLENWLLDPDLLKAKLETLGFEAWPARERRVVARALAVYAQHEIDLADGPAVLDEALLVAKRWAEDVYAATEEPMPDRRRPAPWR